MTRVVLLLLILVAHAPLIVDGALRGASAGVGRGGRAAAKSSARGRGAGAGRGQQPARIPSRSGDDASASRRARKARERAICEAKVDAKLAADASFFWECVQKRQTGVDITGCSGSPPQRYDAATLFGSATAPAVGLDQYDAIPVSRSGAGASEADVPPLGEYTADATRKLPGFALQNLRERMRIERPTPIQNHAVPLALEGFDRV